VRISGVRKQVEAGVNELSTDGMTPRDQLAAMRKFASDLFKEAQAYLTKKLLPKLDQEGIHVMEYEKLTKTQKEKVDHFFREMIYPVLTPLALDPGHPFPHISNLSLSLAIEIRDPKGNEKFARVKVPDTLPRLVPIKRSSGGERKDGTIAKHHYFVWLEQVIAANIAMLFPGMHVVAVHPFRTIRDADVEIQEIEADDLLETMQQSIRRRKFGSVVQISVNESMPIAIRDLLVDNLEARPNDIAVQPSPLGLAALWQLYNSVERHELKYAPYTPKVIKSLKNLETPEDFFAAIRQQNIMVHHPYISFSSVVDFLNAAARDPHVLAIKQTLYRVGGNSPIVESLLEASERGKQVAVLVELKARFDEESNIGWARKLEQAGVHVVYGLMGLKTHCKIGLVVRQEGEGIRRYVHLATGNYNAVTSNLYEDLGMFTADKTIGTDATDLFNFLTGYSAQNSYKKLLVAPVGLRDKLETFILREIEIAKSGREARLIFKANAIVDAGIIQLLYTASQAGVKVDLLIRGICCLRPGIKGISENIRVISVVGRYLEHSRIYYFLNGGKEEIYLGSADLMSRNLNRRVEVAFPIEEEAHIRHIRDTILDSYLRENARARFMQSDGSYVRNQVKDQQTVDIQELLMSEYKSKKDRP
jgi:polyphosphate kinase